MNEAQRKKFEEECSRLDWAYIDKEQIEVVVNHVLSVSDGWIDVKERCPERHVKVLTYMAYPHSERGDGIFAIQCLYEYRWEFDDESQRVTHWMPLPPPPKDSPVSDGLEHSQHKCGHEDVIFFYKQALENIMQLGANARGDLIAKEVLTRMEGKG